MSLPEVALILQAPEIEALKAALSTCVTASSVKEGGENISASEQRTEANISLALAMHLSPEELIEHLVAWPLNVPELTSFEYWFDPLPLHVITRYLDQLQQETHAVRLHRLLWCLARQPLQLTAEQRARIVPLLEHPDALVRTTATKLAYISEDQTLCDHILQSDRRFNEESNSLEPLWGSRVLCRYSTSLSYTELVERLSLGMLGYTIVKRGCRTEEVEHYALYLNAIWHNIARAKDALEPLPFSHRETVEHKDGDASRLQRAETHERTSTERSGAANCRGKSPVGSDDLQGSFPVETNEQRVIEETQLLSIECSSEALRAIYLSRPDLVSRWVEAVLAETRRAHTLLHWCEGFYRGLCAMLASEEPELCFRLWRRLRSRGITVQSIFSAFPFSTRESNEAQQERSRMLEACHNDLALLDLATVATAYKCIDWLIGQARQLVAMRPLWRQAKGIALACLADVDVDEVEQLINVAHTSGTWVASLLPGLHAYHDRNQWAKHWYKRFLTASDRDSSWAAFRLFLSCVDRRCWLWIDRIEQECDSTAALDKTRVQFRLTNSQQIRRAIDHNEKNLKECFLTLKSQDGAIFPYMRDVLTTKI